MIYAKGIISFQSNSIPTKSKIYMKNVNVKMEILEITKRSSSTGEEQSIVITCSYIAHLNEHYECKSLEDYNGKVKPFLQKYIKNLIYRVEVHHLNYLRSGKKKPITHQSS
ncbi:hypothetical protein FQ087_04875 [Sporosarcina sp. ANT_H38]|uniref:hypothetical protein n=1 Tax=Sporosarcina sp. ANT_H38 TaxID=2597358 RepID=UPI0011F32293|nr:hypothetical protein [Sporosarcina sp. ANT_H38]KAA0965631.1 hypothetical protein FQ087_04875 [Sporosarcina sp. ANT_H38]